MADFRMLKKDINQLKKHLKPNDPVDIVVFIGSDEVMMNGEYMALEEFLSMYSKLASYKNKIGQKDWEKDITFPDHWHVITFLDSESKQ